MSKHRSKRALDVGRKSAVLRQRPKVWNNTRLYPKQSFTWPEFILPHGCPSPLSDDCSQLTISARWAVACFKPTYDLLRMKYGDRYDAVTAGILAKVPHCSIPPKRGAEHELHRRIKLSVAILMNREGIPVRYPRAARFPKPQEAASITQPWLRALLTGWF